MVTGYRFWNGINVNQYSAIRTPLKKLAIRAKLPIKNCPDRFGHAIVMVERRDRLIEFQMLGAEQDAAVDRQPVIDDDTLVAGHNRPGLFQRGCYEIEQRQTPLQAHQHNAWLGGFGEESRAARKWKAGIPAGC